MTTPMTVKLARFKIITEASQIQQKMISNRQQNTTTLADIDGSDLNKNYTTLPAHSHSYYKLTTNVSYELLHSLSRSQVTPFKILNAAHASITKECHHGNSNNRQSHAPR